MAVTQITDMYTLENPFHPPRSPPPRLLLQHGGCPGHAALVDVGDVVGAALGHVRHVQGVGLFDDDHVVAAVHLLGVCAVAVAFLIEFGAVALRVEAGPINQRG